jgi:hypothetical protein
MDFYLLSKILHQAAHNGQLMVNAHGTQVGCLPDVLNHAIALSQLLLFRMLLGIAQPDQIAIVQIHLLNNIAGLNVKLHNQMEMQFPLLASMMVLSMILTFTNHQKITSQTHQELNKPLSTLPLSVDHVLAQTTQPILSETTPLKYKLSASMLASMMLVACRLISIKH